MARTPDPWEALRSDYVRIIRATGASEDIALRAAADILRALQERFGGAAVYVPRRARRDETAVLRDYDGRNYKRVCERHGIHPATLYRIVARAKARGESVPDLPPTPAAPTPAPATGRPRHGKPDDFSW